MICHSMHLGGKAMDRAKSLVKYIIAIIMFICGLYITMNSGAVIVTIGVMMIVYSIIDIIEDIIFMKNVKEIF